MHGNQVHIARNWGHVPICFEIGNVSPEFLQGNLDNL
jgi:hypothetical protein